jgi:hypothetical protein
MPVQKQGLVMEWKHQGNPSFQLLENVQHLYVAMQFNVPAMLKIGDCEVSDSNLLNNLGYSEV